MAEAALAYVWFLMATISGPDGYGFNNVGIYKSLAECESASYNTQQYTIDYEQKTGTEVELHCIKHATSTI